MLLSSGQWVTIAARRILPPDPFGALSCYRPVSDPWLLGGGYGTTPCLAHHARRDRLAVHSPLDRGREGNRTSPTRYEAERVERGWMLGHPGGNPRALLLRSQPPASGHSR